MRFARTLLVTCLPIQLIAQERTVPVMVGGDVDLDASGATVRVEGLQDTLGSFLNFRSGPNTKFDFIARLVEGSELVYCSVSDDGMWLGVVFSNGDGDDCGLGGPIAEYQAYRGDCLSGWVHRSFTSLPLQ